MTTFKTFALIGAALFALTACGSGGDSDAPAVIIDADEPTTKL